MNVKRSISLAIRDPARPGMLLLVQRPPDDEDLPDVWGLPAATRAPGETTAAAALRAGRDKLGVDLEIGAVLNEGTKQRDAYRLEMQLIEARIRSGTPDTDRAALTDTTADRGGPADATRDGRAAAAAPADDPGSGARDVRAAAATPADDPGSIASTAAGTTRYQAWRWGPVRDLADAAARGSLCSRLALEVIPRD